MSPVLSTNGLGHLAVLPRELRDQVYKHFMHWFDYKGHENAMNRRATDLDVGLVEKQDSLALLRTSRTIHNEASSLLYDGWTLEIRTKLSLHYWQSSEPSESWPAFFPRVRHPTLGTFHLPTFHGRPEINAESFEYRCIDRNTPECVQLYRSIRYERWRSVTLQMPAPEIFPAEQAYAGCMQAFRAGRVAAYIFEVNPPPSLQIRPTGCWYSSEKPLPMLPEDTTQSAKSVTPFTAVFSAVGDRIETLYLVCPPWSPDHGKPFVSDDFWLGSWNTDFAECWFDLHVDGFLGREAEAIRMNRWCYWSVQYERGIIRAAQSLDPAFADQVLRALTERWAVRRAMDDNILASDERAWREIDPYESIPDYLEEDNDRLPDDTPPESLAYPEYYMDLQRAHPSYQDLMQDGHFYLRRILVLDTGICWDPDHTANSPVPPPAPRPGLLAVHEPPPKP